MPGILVVEDDNNVDVTICDVNLPDGKCKWSA